MPHPFPPPSETHVLSGGVYLSSDVCLSLCSLTVLLSSCLVVASAQIPMSLQLAFLSYVVAVLYSQDGLTGSAWGDWANYTAVCFSLVPPRPFRGFTASLHEWDPPRVPSVCLFGQRFDGGLGPRLTRRSP